MPVYFCTKIHVFNQLETRKAKAMVDIQLLLFEKFEPNSPVELISRSVRVSPILPLKLDFCQL